MKKLILITGILLSTSLWADMDYYCDVVLDYETGKLNEENLTFIKDNCERNNILLISGALKSDLNSLRVLFCRYDRNVNTEPYGFRDRMSITCVLYDNELLRENYFCIVILV